MIGCGLRPEDYQGNPTLRAAAGPFVRCGAPAEVFQYPKKDRRTNFVCVRIEWSGFACSGTALERARERSNAIADERFKHSADCNWVLFELM